MKKQLLQTSLGILFLLPFSLYAAEDAVLPSATIKESSTSTAGTATSTDSTATSAVQLFTECSQQAIEDRDTKIAQTRVLYNTAMAKALIERKNREKAAVAVKDEDDKKTAIKASVDTYKNQAKAAQNTLSQARKLAWQTFENDVEKCHELESEGMNKEQGTSSATTTFKKVEIQETKSIGNTIKAQFESFKSLFN